MTYVATECHTPNKPTTGGYATKGVWDKVAKKYIGWKLHRWVYTQTYGPIPEGYEIDHICHNEAVKRGECQGGECKHRACINPEHLRAVTKSENQKAGAAGFGSRTHCKSRGHELTADNIMTTSTGLACRACHRENAKLATRAYRARMKEKVA